MSKSASRLATLVAAAVLCSASIAHAQVQVVFGQSWDGSSGTLQSILDTQFGVGKVPQPLATFIGAAPGDPDPFFWVGGGFSALLVREIAGNANRNIVGWYLEPADGSKPVIDGVDDGVVFDGPASAGATAVVTFPRPGSFGFYMNPNGKLGANNAPEPEMFFTNRKFNDRGPTGNGAIHAPYDGDVQALIIDISSTTQPNTWLVCFEDCDSGANPGPCCVGTDNDFNDFVFEVQALGVTPVQPISFGSLKVRYR
jgi:hypothetical protein